MNITELRYLVAIMKWGSVSAAAKQMYAAQPNVSKALKNLEEEYGIRMFERSSTGMIPTEQGRHFIEQAQRVLQEVDRLDADARRRQGECAELRVALPHATKQNRRKLLKAYCDKEPLAKLLYLPEETELAIRTSASRMLLVGTAQIAAKATRDSQGVAVVTLKKNQTIASVVPADTLELANPHRYRVRSLPATGALIRAEDEGEQMSLL